MAIQIRKAERRKAKLRLALLGPTGSGKTYSALQLAFGIGQKTGMIDTENGSGDLYANIGDYDIITLEPPYTVQKYREAIRAFEEASYDTIIIDSLTHAWAGEGGLLDKSNQLEKTGRVKNSFAAWREITPEHNKLVEEMLGSPCHIIGTMRVKTEYVLELNEKGKQVPRKIGLAPVQRDGLEYEFTVVMDIDASHVASASKDRTGMFNGWYDTISPQTGKMLNDWLNTGRDAVASAPPPVQAPPSTHEPKRTLGQVLADLESEIESALKLDHPRPAMDALLARPDIKKLEGYVQGEGKKRFEHLVDNAYKRISERELTTDEGYTAVSTSDEIEAEQQAA